MLYFLSSINFYITWLVFWIFEIILDITEGWEQPKSQIPAFNIMMIHALRQTKSVNKQRYWIALMLVRPKGACVGVAK